MVDRSAVLRVDLSAGSVQRERIPDRWRRRYLGGKGIGARYLYAEVDAGTDPGMERIYARTGAGYVRAVACESTGVQRCLRQSSSALYAPLRCSIV